MLNQIAIGSGEKVNLWCRLEDEYPNGRLKFWVINGAWQGSILNGKMTIEGAGEISDAEIVWKGDAPFREAEYNEAIKWIEDQIKGTGNVQI